MNKMEDYRLDKSWNDTSRPNINTDFSGHFE